MVFFLEVLAFFYKSQAGRVQNICDILYNFFFPKM